MRNKTPYYFILLVLSLGFLSGCWLGKKKQINPLITLWRKDKIPYGAWVAFENLSNIFPNATISINKASPADYKEFYNSALPVGGESKKKKAYIIIDQSVQPEPSEINAMMDFIGNGNIIFISSFTIGDSLMNFLKIKTRRSNESSLPDGGMKINVRSPVSNDSLTFEYPGISYNRYVSSMDSQYVSVLGTDQDGHPNFVRFDYKGGGALYLQFAPTAFSNFFLIHKNNKAYYDNVFSYLPSSIKEIKWDDYFRYPRHDGFSAFQYILSIRSFRWAFWLLLLLFLILYIFESQRKQRMIPKVASINNTSLDFVKTVGRLYFQRKDHYNLANKMAAHFLLKVRSRYNLSTSELNDVFAENLAYKSGYDKNLTKEIVDNILYVQLNRELSDHDLMQLNQRLEAFYKNT